VIYSAAHDSLTTCDIYFLQGRISWLYISYWWHFEDIRSRYYMAFSYHCCNHLAFCQARSSDKYVMLCYVAIEQLIHSIQAHTDHNNENQRYHTMRHLYNSYQH